MMNEKMISKLCLECFAEEPQIVARCGVGQGNYVYIAKYEDTRYVVRCSTESGAYSKTIYWLKQLALIDVPVPKVIADGMYDEYDYLILSYIEGKDIGIVYEQLTDEEKRAIAKEIVHIQKKVAALTNMALLNMEYDTDYVKYMLDEIRVSDEEQKSFLFYTLMYCVDFMGERGMQFMDKKVDVNQQIVHRLNSIYDLLWDEWSEIIDFNCNPVIDFSIK